MAYGTHIYIFTIVGTWPLRKHNPVGEKIIFVTPKKLHHELSLVMMMPGWSAGWLAKVVVLPPLGTWDIH